jgi:hypothetical protein
MKVKYNLRSNFSPLISFEKCRTVAQWLIDHVPGCIITSDPIHIVIKHDAKRYLSRPPAAYPEYFRISFR